MSYTDVVDSGGRGSGKYMAEKGEGVSRRWWPMQDESRNEQVIAGGNV